LFPEQPVYAGGSRIGSVRIGKGSWVASHVTVVAGCSIGSGCVVGSNSVVTKNVPDNMFAGGVPARIIGPRVDKEPMIFSRMDLDHFQQVGPGCGNVKAGNPDNNGPLPPDFKMTL
jgi:maltose O-acetyltransferase